MRGGPPFRRFDWSRGPFGEDSEGKLPPLIGKRLGEGTCHQRYYGNMRHTHDETEQNGEEPTSSELHKKKL